MYSFREEEAEDLLSGRGVLSSLFLFLFIVFLILFERGNLIPIQVWDLGF